MYRDPANASMGILTDISSGSKYRWPDIALNKREMAQNGEKRPQLYLCVYDAADFYAQEGCLHVSPPE